MATTTRKRRRELTVPIFIVVALAFAVICTAGLALPPLVLVALAFALRRPAEIEDHAAIATLPGPRCRISEIPVP